MKLIDNLKKDWNEEIKPSFSTKSTKAGSYSLIMVALVLAIIIVFNILINSLPSTWTSWDISSSKLYSVTSSTKVVLNSLEDDVTIYWICQSGSEDTILEKLLENYDALSDKVSVVNINPDVYPTFTASYTSSSVDNNSLIVECNTKYRFISYDELYETSSYYGSTYATAFDGEGEITSAIDYVVNDDFPIMYTLTGHGEDELSDSVSEAILKENIELESLSLLTDSEIDDENSMILINAPQSDISEEEYYILSDYLKNGGHILVVAGPKVSSSTIYSSLSNLEKLLNEFNITAENDFVMEENRNYYAFGYQYLLLPEINNHDITSSLVNENYYAIMYLAKGLVLGDYEGNADIVSLLDTSDSSYSDTNALDSLAYEYEDGDIVGPFSLGVAITTGNDGKLCWFSSAYLLDDSMNSYSSGGNLNLVLNTASWMLGEKESSSIRSKSLSYEYLTISESASATLKTIMIVLIPGFFLAIGSVVVIMRRQKK